MMYAIRYRFRIWQLFRGDTICDWVGAVPSALSYPLPDTHDRDDPSEDAETEAYYARFDMG